jgi:S-adenosylmethionine-diacylglycerol 3-amino-3-carboxypropyl transferase
MKFKNINYSQCWEDSDILLSALKISHQDIVLSITSGGDNTLAVLSKCPERLVSIDINCLQNYLFEFKLAAIKNLSYKEYLELLGVKNSSKRQDYFLKIKDLLSTEARLWWEGNTKLIKGGVINLGRFEIFLRLFSRFFLPLIHSKKTVLKFLDIDNLKNQTDFYDNVWNNHRWYFLFKVFSSRVLLKRFARQKGSFEYATPPDVGSIYFMRFEQNLKNILIKDNYFIRYCLTGSYNLSSLPLYLQEISRTSFVDNNTKLYILTSDMFKYLKSVPNNYFSKFNLSDIFETLSEQDNINLWLEIVRTAKNGAIVAYWNNLVSRTYPAGLSENIFDDKELAIKLNKIDKVPFYGDFHVNIISK